jgi:transcriptional regulator with XRE-family HTH domain
LKASASAVSELIRTVRKEKKLSQSKLSQIVFPNHKSFQFLSNIERGVCQIPARSVNNLSIALGVDKDVIIALMAEDYKNSVIREVLNESSNVSVETNS